MTAKFNWMIVVGDSDKEKAAAEIILNEIHNYEYAAAEIFSASATDRDALKDKDVILLGVGNSNRYVIELSDGGKIEKTQEKEGYSLTVFDSPYGKEKKMAVIFGADGNGLLYGTIDFLNLYMQDANMIGRLRYEMPSLYEFPFSEQLKDFRRISSPSVKERGIWTWGHCIYDYKKFFENMLYAKLNLIVIWVDYVPLNAKEIVDCAHKLGIKVIWGFSWGWENKSAVVTDFSKPENLDEWKKKIVKKYEDEFKDTGADGIYFQTFTERTVNSIDGNNVAKMATDWVNGIAMELYERFGDMRIQFGLHATSVKDDIANLKGVDSRMDIVWEDLGSMPFSYMPDDTNGFDETLSLASKVNILRGENDRCGFILKGFSVLDWSVFKHMTERPVIGEASEKFIEDRIAFKRKQWRLVQAAWLKNIGYAKKAVERLSNQKHGDLNVQMVVEDGMLEGALWLPVALVSEILWDANADLGEIIQRVSLNSRTQFANK